MRVLLADDDRAFTHLLAEWLRAKGYEVQVTPDAATTLVAATARPPDLILLDVRMPAGNGLDTLRKLKRLPRTQNVPVIVISAVQEPSPQEEAVASGAECFLAKPVQLNELNAAIGNALKPTES
jgi:DNA-binding response OmpR family regulator